MKFHSVSVSSCFQSMRTLMLTCREGAVSPAPHHLQLQLLNKGLQNRSGMVGNGTRRVCGFFPVCNIPLSSFPVCLTQEYQGLCLSTPGGTPGGTSPRGESIPQHTQETPLLHPASLFLHAPHQMPQLLPAPWGKGSGVAECAGPDTCV